MNKPNQSLQLELRVENWRQMTECYDGENIGRSGNTLTRASELIKEKRITGKVSRRKWLEDLKAKGQEWISLGKQRYKNVLGRGNSMCDSETFRIRSERNWLTGTAWWMGKMRGRERWRIKMLEKYIRTKSWLQASLETWTLTWGMVNHWAFYASD